MIRLVLVILLTATVCQAAPPPVTVMVSQSDAVNVRIDSGTTPTVSITIPGNDVLSVVTAGPQGIPGPPGEGGGGVSSWDDIPDKPLVFPPDYHTQGIDTITGLQTALNGKEPAGTAAATVATLPMVAHTGSYPDLADKPDIPIACVNVYDGRDGATGAQGPAGATGATGAAGANGTNGKTVLSGSGTPGNGLGVDGDFYIDTAAAHLYGPKASGAWPGTYTELVGPQGPQGPPGASSSITQTAVLQVLDDATDAATIWVQQGPTEQATNAKSGTKDRDGNAKQWIDGNGTIIRQCITADVAPAFKMLNPSGSILYSVACNGTMEFTGTVTIK